MKPKRLHTTPYKKTPAKIRPNINTNNTEKIPVQVFCRIRPLDSAYDERCLKQLSNTMVQLSNVESNVRDAREIHYKFSHVFDENRSQKELFDMVGLESVENVLNGRNGLLFTYGVTGSGKTYTMNGIPQDGGLIPRTMDVIFNSISELQTKKFVFKSDRMNGFDPQMVADAMLDRQKELFNNISTPSRTTLRTPRKQPQREDLHVPDPTKVKVNSSGLYGVFVSYIEIYNNFIYDLLEETPIDILKTKPFQSKLMREDKSGNMFIHGVNELEIKTVEEGLEILDKGRKRKKIAHTTLNTHSSRSHSVFTIRIVFSPLDPGTDEVVQDPGNLVVSQLSLVDLAGSERSNRTNNSGDRQREANNINTSLMVLRQCLEALREKQQSNGDQIIPYRTCKLTHLFRNYFEGEGRVSMVVCANPHIDEFDENIHVLRFAEMTQEVKVSRNLANPISQVVAAAEVHAKEKAFANLNKNPYPPLQIAPVYSLGPEYPDFYINDPEDVIKIHNLVTFLEMRIDLRGKLENDLGARQVRFRKLLEDTEMELKMLRADNVTLKSSVELEKNKVLSLEDRVVTAENTNMNINRTVDELKEAIRSLEYELSEKDMQLTQGQMETDRVRTKMTNKLESQKERFQHEIQEQMLEKTSEMKNKIRAKDSRLRAIRHLVGDADTESSSSSSGMRQLDFSKIPLTTSSSDSDLHVHHKRKSSNPPTAQVRPSVSESRVDLPLSPSQQYLGSPMSSSPDKTQRGIAVSNLRHRRSQSADSGQWLDHRPIQPVPLGTVFQPLMRKRHSVTKLTDVKDLANSKTSKYCLTTQDQDGTGDLETKLYKGNVIPTCTGGAQVVFNDVEVLRQVSPSAIAGVKRAAQQNMATTDDVQEKCKQGLEGHSTKSLYKRSRY